MVDHHSTWPAERPQADVVARDHGTVAAAHLRLLTGWVAAVTVLLFLMVSSIAIGSNDIPLSTVWQALWDNSGRSDDYVVWNMRMPRALAAACVGVAMGVSGALIQALTRNPLADPGLLGVNAGAAFFVALGIAVFGMTSISDYMWLAFAGALVVTAAVYAIGSAGRDPADPVRLTVAGVALAAVLSGIVSAMILLDPRAFDQMRSWSAGSVAGLDLDVLMPVLPFLAIGLVLAVAASRPANTVALGDELAASLGANVTRARVLVIVAVTLLAGGATAIAGPVAFVGLVVPHVARWITGPDQRWILAYTIALAPSLTLAADVAGRVLLADGEIPVGIMTAFVGAPVLVMLVRRRRASGL